MPSLFASLPAHLPAELSESLVRAKHVRIERIASQGHTSAADYWYDQPANEFVLVVQGSGRLRFEDDVVELGPGDWLNIPAHQKHRVEWTTPDEQTVWLAVFYDGEQ